ncbi:MAG: DUF3137 domain-containing protein [Candidatus Omnitrophota bacterium]
MTRRAILILFVLVLFLFSAEILLAQTSQVAGSAAASNIKGAIVVFGVIGIIVFLIAKSSKKAEQDKEKRYKQLALKLNLRFYQKDTIGLSRHLEGTSLAMESSEPSPYLSNIFVHSDSGGNSYIFHRIHFTYDFYHTVYLYQANQYFEADLIIRPRGQTLMGRILRNREGKDLKEITAGNNQAFNDHFVVYADRADAAKNLIRQEVQEYYLANKGKFLKPCEVFTLIDKNNLMIFVQHNNGPKDFDNNEELEQFILLAQGLKNKLI